MRVPPGEESYVVRRVWLSETEENGYYYSIANEGLWPLCHIAHARPVFRASDWAHYRAVNRRFADAVCEEVDTDDPIIIVQDYHLALAPRMIRERLHERAARGAHPGAFGPPRGPACGRRSDDHHRRALAPHS